MTANSAFTPPEAISPWSKRWRGMVEYRLRLGFGVEDIAVQLDCKPERVREHVIELREAGKLAAWWPKPAVAAE